MKNYLVRMLTVMLACLLLTVGAVGISVMADSDGGEIEISVEIDKKNISYDSAAQVLYTVDARNLPADATVKMLFDSEEIAADDVKNKNVNNLGLIVKEASGEHKGQPVFFSYGVYAKNFRKALWAMPVVVSADDNVIACGNSIDYNPYDYVMDRFTGGDFSTTQEKLYKSFLHYGASVQEVLGYSDEVPKDNELNVNTQLGGWIDEYYVVTVGEEVKTYRGTKYKESAPVVTADRYKDGQSFNGWTDANGNTVVGWTTLDVKPGYTVLNTTYAPVNGNVYKIEDSASLPEGAVFSSSSGAGYYEILGDENDKYIRFGKTNRQVDGSSITFAPANPGVFSSQYVYEMDFAIEGWDLTSSWVYKFCLYSKKGEIANVTAMSLGKDKETYRIGYTNKGDYVDLKFGEWAHLKLVLQIYEDKSPAVSAYVNGKRVDTTHTTENAVIDYRVLKAGVALRDSTSHDCKNTSILIDDAVAYTNGIGVPSTVTLDATGSEYGVQTFKENLGEKYTLPVPQTDGELVFTGWYNGTTLVEQSGDVWSLNGKETLTAGWKRVVTSNTNTFDNGKATNASLVAGKYSDGAATTVPTGWSNTYFSVGKAGTVYSGFGKGVKYVFETDFTYNGGAVYNSSNPTMAFVGFVHETNSNRANQDMIKLSAFGMSEAVDETGKSAYVNLYGQSFYAGITYRLKIEFYAVTNEVRIYVDGVRKTTPNLSTGESTNDSTCIEGFAFQFRDPVKGASFTFDNTYCGVEYAEMVEFSTVTFDAVGGNVSKDPVYALYDQSYKLPTPTHDNENYTFIGWFDGDKHIASDSDWKYMKGDVELCAKWIVADNYNLGTKTVTSTGWSASNSFTIKGADASAVYSAGTLYTINMKYTYNGLTSFTINNETGEVTPTSMTHGYGFIRFYSGDTRVSGGSKHCLVAGDFVDINGEIIVENNKLISKYLDENGKVKLDENGNPIIKSTDIFYSNYTWYGMSFKKDVTYDITFYVTLNGSKKISIVAYAVDEDGNVQTSVASSTDCEKAANNITKLVFESRSPATNTTYKNSQTFEKVTFYCSEASDVVDREYITLDADGGVVDGENKVAVYYGSEYTIPEKATRVGYDFIGWYDGETKIETFSGTWNFYDGATFVAKWAPKTVNVTLMDGETVLKTFEMTNGEEYDFSTVEEAAKEGLVLVNWYQGLKLFPMSGKFVSDDDITLTAKYATGWDGETYTFEDGKMPSTFKGGGMSVVDGKMEVVYNGSGMHFVVNKTNLPAGSKYVMEFELTYNSGTIQPSSDVDNFAFVGFSTTNASWQDTTVDYTTIRRDTNAFTLYGNTIAMGSTYTVRIEYTVGTYAETGNKDDYGTTKVYINGVEAKNTNSGNGAKVTTENNFYQFNIQWRGGTGNLSLTMDNIVIGVEGPAQN